MEPVVLIVDDNKEIIEFLTDNLKPTYSVLSCYDGNAAMETLEKESVHLIVSDIMMPVMDGFELCKKVKSSFKSNSGLLLPNTRGPIKNIRSISWIFFKLDANNYP